MFIFRKQKPGFFLLILLTIIFNNANAQSSKYETALTDCLSKRRIQIDNTGCMNGIAAPKFSGKTLGSKLIDLKKLTGSVVVINFWFVDCAPCRLERPSLNKIASRFKNEKVLFISVASDKAAKLTNYLKSNPFSFETIVDADLTISEKIYHIRSYPTTIVIDKKGLIKLFTQGGKDSEIENDKILDENLVCCIDECLGKKHVRNNTIFASPDFLKF